MPSAAARRSGEIMLLWAFWRFPVSYARQLHAIIPSASTSRSDVCPGAISCNPRPGYTEPARPGSATFCHRRHLLRQL